MRFLKNTQILRYAQFVYKLIKRYYLILSFYCFYFVIHVILQEVQRSRQRALLHRYRGQGGGASVPLYNFCGRAVSVFCFCGANTNRTSPKFATMYRNTNG